MARAQAGTIRLKLLKIGAVACGPLEVGCAFGVADGHTYRGPPSGQAQDDAAAEEPRSSEDGDAFHRFSFPWNSNGPAISRPIEFAGIPRDDPLPIKAAAGNIRFPPCLPPRLP
jgi:hypothetical protein